MMCETESGPDLSEGVMTRLRAGDREAAEQVFAFHRRHLLRTARSHLDGRIQGRLDPSDVVQNALCEAARRLPDYLAKEPVSFALWLRQIVLDEVHKAWRRHGQAARRSVTKEMPLPDRSSLILARQLPRAQSSPSQHLSRKETARRVRAAMERLPDSDRIALELRHFEEQPYAEIGLIMGISEQAARKRCVRALLRLGQMLEGEELGGGS
ncbi:MAG: sigma-70 family RNA polymerase sigma factor [Verrucomicrobiales bacterium]|nr:sigma-70 family RNA polymerase sigma factor [Verrucomicrobiales bacterium]MCP5527486.1 sigma-70 family RNA polymerase sigma factor [Verrucomicrobiales bacterium]